MSLATLMLGTAAALLSVTCRASAEGPANASSTTTVVFVLVDDLGHGDLGFRGSEIKTPVIDKLATHGVILDNYYVQRACSPTRAALLTGRYNIRYGFASGVLKPLKPYGLALNESLLPQFLTPLGFTAHIVGKWHVGYWRWAHTPTHRGFNSFYGYYSGAEDYYSHMNGHGLDFRLDEGPNCGANCTKMLAQCSHEDQQEDYSTLLYTARAESLIAAHDYSASKLFLYLPYQAVHVPDQVPDRYKAPYSFPNPSRNTFAGMLACLDEGIGNITRGIQNRNEWENTLFILSNDNGAATGACGGASGAQNWPLRGGKCTAWDGGLRGTSFVYSEKLLSEAAEKGGFHMAGLAHVSDWLPTILGALGADVSAVIAAADTRGFPLDGVNQWPLISSPDHAARGTSLRPHVLLELDLYSSRDPNFGGDQHGGRGQSPYAALREGKWKLLLGNPGGGPVANAWWCTGPPCPFNVTTPPLPPGARTDYDASSVLLFDLEKDPGEQHDVSTTNAVVVARLRALIQGYNKTSSSSAQQGLPDDMRADPATRADGHAGTIFPWR